MIDNKITFIIHLRKDTEERKKNIDYTVSYYSEIAPNAKIIIVEDDAEQNFTYLSERSNIEYIFYKNTSTYNKCKSYNIGLERTNTDIVCFLDADCIVSEQSLKKSIQVSHDDNCLCIGYNGVAIYLTYKSKQLLNTINKHTNIYDILEPLIDKNNLYNEYKTDMYKVGNIKAVGGCLIGKRSLFKQINGFNPFFVGWGFEDNEIINRATKLNVSVVYINTKKSLLFHLPHEDDESARKNIHTSYSENYTEYLKINSMATKDLENYIKTW